MIALFYSLGSSGWQLAAEIKRQKHNKLELKLDSTFKKVEKDVINNIVADSVKNIASELTHDSLQQVAPDSLYLASKKSANNDSTSRFIKKKVDLDNIVEFSAKDSLILEGKNSAFMYGESKITYGDINLSANKIRMDMKSSVVHAEGVPDSIGDISGTPVFKDNSGEYS